jgi:predicted peptidase
LPEGYNNDNTRRWPLVMFLHGSGESGTDLQKVKANGPPGTWDFVIKHPEEFAAIVPGRGAIRFFIAYRLSSEVYTFFSPFIQV